MDTSFQSLVYMNAQKKDADMSLERRLVSGVLAETIKFFKGYTIQSTINDLDIISPMNRLTIEMIPRNRLTRGNG